MRSIKNHIGVIFPLIVLLFSMEFVLIMSKVVTEYEHTMSNDYNIIIVSQNELNKEDMKSKIPSFKDISLISVAKVLDRLKKDISDTNLLLLNNSLPRFYSLKLNNFPDSDGMKNIKNILLKIDGVKRVETFSKTYDKVYKMLLFSKSIFECFTILITIMGVVLIFKQMKIWLFEHKIRVEIMTLFGAPYWLKSAMLYKLALIDSIISTFLVTLFYSILPNLTFFKDLINTLGLDSLDFNLLFDSLILLASSIIVSIIAVSLVMFRTKEKT